MNKKIFDKRLCFEGIKSLKLVGMVFLVLGIIISFLIPFNTDKNLVDKIYTISRYLPHIMAIHTVITPCLTLYMFSFLLKRNASDFYHSIPHKRTCLFLSFFVSVVAWIIIIITAITLSSMLASKIMITGIKIDIGNIVLTTIGLFIASITVAAGICFAETITGNIISNIVVSGYILILPRVIYNFVLYEVCENSYELFIYDKYLLESFINKNLSTRIIVYDYYAYQNPFKYWHNWLYTGVIFLLFLILAIVFFNKRKSEAAGNPSTSRVLQNVYRILFAMIISLIPINQCVNRVSNSYLPDGKVDIKIVISYYVLVIFGYFIFEILMTKSFKTLVKTIPGLGIVAVLNILMITGIIFAGNKIVYYSPSPKELDRVVFYVDTYDVNNRYKEIEYVTKDEKVMKVFCDALKAEVKYYESGGVPDMGYMYDICFVGKNGVKHFRRLCIDENVINSAISKVKDEYEFRK